MKTNNVFSKYFKMKKFFNDESFLKNFLLKKSKGTRWTTRQLSETWFILKKKCFTSLIYFYELFRNLFAISLSHHCQSPPSVPKECACVLLGEVLSSSLFIANNKIFKFFSVARPSEEKFSFLFSCFLTNNRKTLRANFSS